MKFVTRKNNRKRRIGGMNYAAVARQSRSSPSDRNELFTRRAFLIGAMQGGIISGLAARLAWLQIVEGETYAIQAEQNRIHTQMVAPERGIIVDRNGVPLAINIDNFQAVIVPEQARNIEEVLFRLQSLVDLSDARKDKILRDVRRRPSFLPINVKDHLDWDEIARIEVNRPDLQGVRIEQNELRRYPLGDITAHSVGYVGRASDNDLDKQDQNQLYLLPGVKIGKTGLEKEYETRLRGKPGSKNVEKNAEGRDMRVLSARASQQGDTLKLTIDAELQKFVQNRLAKEISGAAIIMDTHSGAVYAMSSYPSFNPNLFVEGISQKNFDTYMYQAYDGNYTTPLNNKITQGRYPPGSTFKMIVALAGLEMGIIDPADKVWCPGVFKLGNKRFHCWKHEGHGHMNLIDALEQSCDVYFYEKSLEIGVDNIAKYARRFGFEEDFSYFMPEVKKGVVPTESWKYRKTGEKWQKGETVVSSIGQGFVEATPIELAVMTARLVNGGRMVKPWLTESQKPSGLDKRINISQKNLDIIKVGMDRVVIGERGTARGSRLPIKGIDMGGKTGTSQVARITAAERAQGLLPQDQRPWRLRHHALFVGYAPYDNPRYTCAVIVEHGGSGSKAAAPVARDILTETLKRQPGQGEELQNVV